MFPDRRHEPEEPDPNTQLGWFQVTKITYNISEAKHKRFSSEIKDWTQDPVQASDERANLLHYSGRTTYGKIGVHPHTPLPLTTSTSLAPALDRRHNTAW
jgi:hypothetical protein